MSSNNQGNEQKRKPPCRVLVVDDEPDICELLSMFLRGIEECYVHSENDPRRALLAIENHMPPYSGFFLDIQMPDITGLELCSLIRGTPLYRDVPIIMLTAMTEKTYVREAFARGATEYITKPFDFEDVKAKLLAGRN